MIKNNKLKYWFNKSIVVIKSDIGIINIELGTAPDLDNTRL